MRKGEVIDMDKGTNLLVKFIGVIAVLALIVWAIGDLMNFVG